MIISLDTSNFLQNYELVFVTGHPRSGTTIVHALVCSGAEVNDYIPESSYLTGMVNNFIAGFNNEIHNVNFFGSKQAYVDYTGKQVRNFVNDCWVGFGAPKVLALKDPVMMNQLDALNGIFPSAKFIIALRDPFEVVSSFCKVKSRQGIVADATVTQEIARNAAIDYKRAIRFKTSYPERTLLFHYDSVFDGSYDQKLSSFSPNIRCNPDNLWKSKFVKDVQAVKTPWITDKYGEMMGKVSRTEPDLSEEQREIVKRFTFEDYEKAVSLT
ncbi:MAG: hypothetical protein CMO06_09205 [Thalassospira sp.]|uniref:sulfotransferase family protein n=1 Tax=Thalassospira sp. TaxID=1912094 RepID=UPI000C6117B2|nr:sulfotransferase [Thalassospira sp.]MAZ33308.1 hypothetical protein [Thalassospira sp.]|tara:strand:+ start:993 stop:1802 length:810 start_codon:yes stop_codon:yes gene_type:complete